MGEEESRMSETHENANDRMNQSYVASKVVEWLNRLPAIGGNGSGFWVKLVETRPNEEDIDYSLHWNHLMVGVIEIKCFTNDYASLMIDRPKLKCMWGYTNRGYPALLVFRTPEGIWMADQRILIERQDQWKDATDEQMSTTNHGKDTRKKPFKGYLLPKSLFWRVE
jgi:hypothetical protein